MQPPFEDPDWTDTRAEPASPDYVEASSEIAARPAPIQGNLPAVQQTAVSPQIAPEAVVAQIGTITITQTRVYTPTGDFALRGSTWRVQDSTHIQTVVPGWAMALAIVLCLCTFGLSFFFLFVRETRYTGAVEVTAANDSRQYTARIPITNQGMVQAIFNQVNWVQSLAGQDQRA